MYAFGRRMLPYALLPYEKSSYIYRLQQFPTKQENIHLQPIETRTP